jgi:3-hydroxyisobutyrate dehydrogenase-like beta-hydroxyacid dehydrogenase
MENRKNIGFIGVGTMGQLMALNLVKAGQSLTVWRFRQEWPHRRRSF